MVDVAVCTATLYGSDIGMTRLVEWIEHNMLNGVSLVVIYDRDDVYGEALRRMYPDGRVEVVHFPVASRDPGNAKRYHGYYDQIIALNACLDRLRGRARWVGFFDIDEFIDIRGMPMAAARAMHAWENNEKLLAGVLRGTPYVTIEAEDTTTVAGRREYTVGDSLDASADYTTTSCVQLHTVSMLPASGFPNPAFTAYEEATLYVYDPLDRRPAKFFCIPDRVQWVINTVTWQGLDSNKRRVTRRSFFSAISITCFAGDGTQASYTW